MPHDVGQRLGGLHSRLAPAHGSGPRAASTEQSPHARAWRLLNRGGWRAIDFSTSPGLEITRSVDGSSESAKPRVEFSAFARMFIALTCDGDETYTKALNSAAKKFRAKV